MSELANRVALVTGGSRGIGAAIALRLAALGADVAVTYETNADRAAEISGKTGGVAFGPDVDAVSETVAAFGRIDILVNNAGVLLTDPADFDRTIAVNVRAPYLASLAAAQHMTTGGRIISIGSNVAVRTPFPGLALYAMSKSALVGMTKGLARDLGPRGITVNLVNPGPTDTDANPADGPNAPAIRGLTALGRYAEPAEIADVVAFLAGDGGSYVTGASINADGGFTA